MKYVALLRGINVGDNSIIKMADLKAVVEQSGFTNVKTYIQSGNIFLIPKRISKLLEPDWRACYPGHLILIYALLS